MTDSRKEPLDVHHAVVLVPIFDTIDDLPADAIDAVEEMDRLVLTCLRVLSDGRPPRSSVRLPLLIAKTIDAPGSRIANPAPPVREALNVCTGASPSSRGPGMTAGPRH
jgi:hypothetical protein